MNRDIAPYNNKYLYAPIDADAEKRVVLLIPIIPSEEESTCMNLKIS